MCLLLWFSSHETWRCDGIEMRPPVHGILLLRANRLPNPVRPLDEIGNRDEEAADLPILLASTRDRRQSRWQTPWSGHQSCQTAREAKARTAG